MTAPAGGAAPPADARREAEASRIYRPVSNRTGLTGYALHALAACAVAALAVSAAGAHAQDSRVGVLLDTDDPFDAQRLEAMRAGVYDFNGMQGPDGLQIELRLYDMEHGSALEALREAHAGGAGPSVYLGPTYSGDVESILEYVEDNSLAIISPSSSASALSVPDGVFRLTAPVHLEAGALAQLVSDSGAVSAVAAVQGDAFGKSVLEDMRRALEKRGIPVGTAVEFSTDGSDWLQALGRVDSALSADPGAALVLVAGFDSDLGAMTLAASEYANASSAEWFVPSGAIYPQEGAPAPDISITTLSIEAGGNPVSDRLDSVMRDAGNEPSVYDYSAYDSVFVAGAALEAGGEARERIPAAALALSGALGDIELDGAGDLASPVVYGVWRSADGQWSRSGPYDAQSPYCRGSAGTVPIVSNSDGSVACVSPATAEALQERGWGAAPAGGGLSGSVRAGHLVPQTGDLSSGGSAVAASALLAVSDFNDHLAGLGERWRLVLVAADTATDPETALEAAKSFRSAGITAVAGPIASANAKAIKGYADDSGMIVVSCCSTAPELAISGDSLYRMTPDDSNEGVALAALLEHHGIDRAVAAWRGDTWGDGLAGAWKSASGGTAAEGVRYEPGSPDPGSVAAELASQVSEASAAVGSGNTAVLVFGFSETADIVRASMEYAELGQVRWYGAGVVNSAPQFSPPEIDEFLTSVKFTTPGAKAVPSEARQSVQERLSGELGETAGRTFVHASYDSVWLLGLSMLEAGSSEGADLRRVISGVADGRQGAIGDMTLNAAGDLAQADYEFWQTVEGGQEPAGTYEDGAIVPP